jgi:hypothetical protein
MRSHYGIYSSLSVPNVGCVVDHCDVILGLLWGAAEWTAEQFLHDRNRRFLSRKRAATANTSQSKCDAPGAFLFLGSCVEVSKNCEYSEVTIAQLRANHSVVAGLVSRAWATSKAPGSRPLGAVVRVRPLKGALRTERPVHSN